MTTLRFEARDLTPWAEYVTTDHLRVGDVYFDVRFLDDDSLVPVLEPLVFIGYNLGNGDTSAVYFQDAASYLSGVHAYSPGQPPQPSGTEAVVCRFTGDGGHVLTYDRALEVLMRCSLRRARHPKTGDNAPR